MSPAGGRDPAGDELVSAALVVLGGAAALSAVLRAAASVACWLAGLPAPTGGVANGLGALARPLDPGTAVGTPALSPILYWAVAAVMLAAVGAAAAVLVARWQGRQRRPDPRRLDGVATGGDIARTATGRPLRRRAATLRPSLTGRIDPHQVGYLLGSARGRRVWASVEDSILVLGPPRSGKGLHLVTNFILDAPGAVVTTSTRPDNLTITLAARRRRGGPVAVFDPQHLAPGLPAGLRWSLVRGCEDPLTAMIRAAGLSASTGLGGGGVENGGFWEGKTRAAIQALLHAAALDERDARSLYRWALSPAAAGDAVRVLASTSQAADGWAESLDSMIQSDPRTRDSIWQGVGLALGALADPRVLDAVTPRESESFDPGAFLEQRGTLFLLATGAGAGASAALVAAFVEDLVETARRMAARSPGARLDPPVLLALDEIGTLAPLPSLPTLMAEGGGTGLTTVPVLQSLAQAREKWGPENAGAIWDASIVKVVLGGSANAKDLQDVAALLGERDEPTVAVSRDTHGGRSYQTSLRRVPVMPPDVLRTLPFGTAVTLLRSAPPIVTNLRAWTARPDAKTLRADRGAIEAMLRSGA
jgi:type IV secretory pathway TraG/TraD family ATPase VirD4